ncbi:helix-turn-helix domain-containing protein [Saccharopolyspora pogona]|uniref:helix-turn-helix domain-containing protein n=1 Tax=Saccharopolyspora pogona TaxID=333966 RepID=UPI0016841856|nr:helix-turn-helix domain-containing protein [Saccharopolyspora pogona]
MLETLNAYLSNQRSWQRTSATLHVHRQTVLYRIRKIEELTHHDLSETSDIAELWLALRALELISQ